MDVVHADPVDQKVFDPGGLDGRSELDLSVGRQETVVDLQVRMAGEHRPEVVERHALEGKERVEAEIRLREEIRVSVDLGAAGVEHDPLRVDRRRIDAIGGADVPDVVRAEKEVRDLQRP